MRYPITFTAPDGRRITCYDGEHAAAVHLLSSWLIWPKVGRFVRDRDGDIDWTRLQAQAQLFASSERLLAEAAMDLYCGPGQDTAVGLKRPCAGRRAPSPGAAGDLPAAARRRPGWGVGSVSDRDAAKAKTHLNVALIRLDEAARHAHEAGMPGQAGTLERLARDAAEVLGKLQPTGQPTLPVDQAAGDDDEAAAS